MPSPDVRIGRAQVDAFAERLDRWLRQQSVEDQVLMAILTHDLSPTDGDAQRYTLPGFVPKWAQQVCEWKLKLLGGGPEQTAVIDIDDPKEGSKVVAEVDLGEVFQDVYSW